MFSQFTILERIPSFVYPWGSEAFADRLNECLMLYGIEGAQYHCTDILVWHGLIHFIGALCIVYIVIHLRKVSLSMAIALSITLALFFLWQELIDQPARLQQIPFKSWLDILTWLTPLSIYWFVPSSLFTFKNRKRKKYKKQ